MAILAAFNSPAVEVVGLTTLFGNVSTPQATANALVLRELAGREEVSNDAPSQPARIDRMECMVLSVALALTHEGRPDGGVVPFGGGCCGRGV